MTEVYQHVEYRALFAAACADPGDYMIQHVLTDWLEEHGIARAIGEEAVFAAYLMPLDIWNFSHSGVYSGRGGGRGSGNGHGGGHGGDRGSGRGTGGGRRQSAAAVARALAAALAAVAWAAALAWAAAAPVTVTVAAVTMGSLE